MAEKMDPLTDADLDTMNRNLERLNEAMRLAERAKEGGLDVDAEIARIEAEKQRILLLKQAFFPGR